MVGVNVAGRNLIFGDFCNPSDHVSDPQTNTVQLQQELPEPPNFVDARRTEQAAAGDPCAASMSQDRLQAHLAQGLARKGTRSCAGQLRPRPSTSLLSLVGSAFKAKAAALCMLKPPWTMQIPNAKPCRSHAIIPALTGRSTSGFRQLVPRSGLWLSLIASSRPVLQSA